MPFLLVHYNIIQTYHLRSIDIRFIIIILGKIIIQVDAMPCFALCKCVSFFPAKSVTNKFRSMGRG